MKRIHVSLFYTFIFLLFFGNAAFCTQINITPVLEISEEYNDNIFQDPSDTEDDFLTTISPGFILEIPWQTAGFTVNYSPSYVFYHQNDDLNDWRHSLNASAYKEFTSKTRFEVTEDYLLTEEPDSRDRLANPEDPLESPAITPDRLRRGREKRWTNTSAAKLEHRFGIDNLLYTAFRHEIRKGIDTSEDDTYLSSPSAGVTYRITQHVGIESEFYYINENQPEGDDLDGWYGRMRGLWRLTRYLSLYAQYTHTIADYHPHEDETRISANEDFSLYEPTVGFTYNIDQDTRIDIGAGYYFQEFKSGDGDDGGFVVEAKADKVWRYQRGLVGLTFSSGNEVSTGTETELGLHQYYDLRGRAEYNFSKNLSGNLFAGYQWDKYPDEKPEARTDKTILTGTGLTYQLYRWMALQLNYEYTDLNTDVDEDAYTENRVIFLIRLTPSSPYRL